MIFEKVLAVNVLYHVSIEILDHVCIRGMSEAELLEEMVFVEGPDSLIRLYPHAAMSLVKFHFHISRVLHLYEQDWNEYLLDGLQLRIA